MFRIPENYKHDCHLFSHKAMATVFEIVIYGEEKEYAHQAALEAFLEIDRLELLLSRFIENSDISRLNAASENEAISVNIDVFECLRHCKAICEATGGAFDITSGHLVNLWRKADKLSRMPTSKEISAALAKTGSYAIILDENNMQVCLNQSPMHIDLGAYGKGYALDAVAEIFGDWDIGNFMLHGGGSSVLAKGILPGENGWPVSLSHPEIPEKAIKQFSLSGKAVSGSGLEKGQHIIDPRSGYPAQANLTAWAIADSAALSDALSTAFMIMSPAKIETFCQAYPKIKSIVLPQFEKPENSNALFFGDETFS